MNNSISFKDIALSMGIEESAARVSMAMPLISDDVIQYRTFCIGEMILKRQIENGILKEITKNHWGEIRRCYTASKDKVIAVIELNSSAQPFPLEIPLKALTGHKDSIVQNLRKVERLLPERLKIWSYVTKNGMIRFSSCQDLLSQMNKSLSSVS